MDNLNRRAKFEDVKKDKEALNYHADQFQKGYRYLLAKQCWHYLNVQKNPES